MNRLQRVLTLASIVAGATAAALLIAEGVLRVAHLAPTDGVATVNDGEFRQIPGIFAPGQDLIDRRDPHLPYHVTTNGLGFRGSDFPRSKPPGEVRMLFTGDSFTFGDFVDDDQTLPAQVERRLRARCGAVRVVNAGLGDATIVDEAHQIERGLTVSPDVVILLFSENDVDDLNRVSTWDRLADNRRAKSRFPFSLVYPLLRRTARSWPLPRRSASRAKRATPPSPSMPSATASQPPESGPPTWPTSASMTSRCSSSSASSRPTWASRPRASARFAWPARCG